MRILMAASDTRSARRIETMLQPLGFNVFVTDLGEELIHLACKFDYDLILLNAFLDDMTGWRALRGLRELKIELPVLVLADPAGIADVCRGFGFRGVHSLAEPFRAHQLVTSIHDLLPASRDLPPTVVEIGKFKIDLRSKTVEVDGHPLRCRGKEYQILELLALRKGTPVTKEEFLEHLYGGMDEPELKIIDVFICHLRKRMQAATGGPHIIETVWGKGYVVRDPAPEVAIL